MTNTTLNIETLENKAKIIRRHIINMLCNAESGHTGGSLSCVDILVALYFSFMNHKQKDKFILSKGHAAPALYATLAELGYFSLDKLKTLRKNDGYLQGHPVSTIPGIVASSGSLGQGLSIANGIALAAKLDKLQSKIFVLLGDGECDEGQVWEAAMLSSHYKLDNLIAIVDRNQLQIDGKTEDIMRLEPFAEKWKSFGWHVFETNGNNIEEIIYTLNSTKYVVDRPSVIIANTIKGKGVSFCEGVLSFHGTPPNKEQSLKALEELK